MLADPEVSKRKFAKEVKLALEQPYWQRQGVWILRAEFPIVFVAFVTPKRIPNCPGVIAAVHIDFSDYDVRPPSVRLVDPFTEAPVSRQEVIWDFPKAQYSSNAGTNANTIVGVGSYVQSFENEKPFFCLAGIREYHECSAHSGDSWFSHRKSKEGLLVQLLTILQRYGPGAVQQIQVQISLVGSLPP